jgi:hypothetical protein
VNYSPRKAPSLDEELEQPAKELIRGDSYGGSHGEEAVREALRNNMSTRRSYGRSVSWPWKG